MHMPVKQQQAMLLQHRHVCTLFLESHYTMDRQQRMERLMLNHRQPTQFHLHIPHAHLIQLIHHQRIHHHSLLHTLLHHTQNLQHIIHLHLHLHLIHPTILHHHIHLHLKLHPTILQVLFLEPALHHHTKMMLQNVKSEEATCRMNCSVKSTKI
ncbi:hypothetical protein OIU79_014272 [Salix purpurea]|uniref:Uncharacterized protein n=1 Tax=Salix purpurea TaxID=77065 RepID=A0A9Q0PR53_SALPP|nr:hypothetical protein OIU79_014272 [Salix purpurea]